MAAAAMKNESIKQEAMKKQNKTSLVWEFEFKRSKQRKRYEYQRIKINQTKPDRGGNKQ